MVQYPIRESLPWIWKDTQSFDSLYNEDPLSTCHSCHYHKLWLHSHQVRQIGSWLSPDWSARNHLHCKIFWDRMIVMHLTRHAGICFSAWQLPVEQLSLLSLSKIAISWSTRSHQSEVVPSLKCKESHSLQNLLCKNHCHASDKTLSHLFVCMTITHWAAVTPVQLPLQPKMTAQIRSCPQFEVQGITFIKKSSVTESLSCIWQDTQSFVCLHDNNHWAAVTPVLVRSFEYMVDPNDWYTSWLVAGWQSPTHINAGLYNKSDKVNPSNNPKKIAGTGPRVQGIPTYKLVVSTG